jgi:hypothetical protein
MGRKSITTPKAKMAADNINFEKKKALLNSLDSLPVKLHSYLKDMINAGLFGGVEKIMEYIDKIDNNNEVYYNQIVELTREKENLQLKIEKLEVKPKGINPEIIENCLRMTEFHLTKVKESTGEVTYEDMIYCINLTQRILEKEVQNASN